MLILKTIHKPKEIRGFPSHFSFYLNLLVYSTLSCITEFLPRLHVVTVTEEILAHETVLPSPIPVTAAENTP